MAAIRGLVMRNIPGRVVRREVVRMSRRKVRDKGLQAKFAELREVNERIIEVEKSIEELRGYHKELGKRRFGIKTEIRFLGGKVPASKDHAGGVELWRTKREGRASNEKG